MENNQAFTLGQKLTTTQKFDRDGKRLPITMIAVDSTANFTAGDTLKVAGTSKGKGFAGVVKRWGFHGGPKTHGQSDRERHPGSIGQTTTPGRVYKGKRMAGRMGGQRVTISGLALMAVLEKEKQFLVKGLVPGAEGGKLEIKKFGQLKKFVPLAGYEEKAVEEPAKEAQSVETKPIKEVKSQEPVVAQPETKAEAKSTQNKGEKTNAEN
jgi:hypothetical protein